MKVFIEYMVSVSALVEKEVPEGTDYHDIINSVTRGRYSGSRMGPPERCLALRGSPQRLQGRRERDRRLVRATGGLNEKDICHHEN